MTCDAELALYSLELSDLYPSGPSFSGGNRQSRSNRLRPLHSQLPDYLQFTVLVIDMQKQQIKKLRKGGNYYADSQPFRSHRNSLDLNRPPYQRDCRHDHHHRQTGDQAADSSILSTFGLDPVVNSSGQVAFTSLYNGGGGGIFLSGNAPYNAGNFSTVASLGDSTDDGTGDPATFTGYSIPVSTTMARSCLPAPPP